MKALSYSDISLIPRYSELRSRSDADVSVEFLGRRLALPITPSNMSSVISPDIAHWLSENDYPYFMHRFSDTLDFVERANRESWKLISISVGVKFADKLLLTTIADKGLRVDWICVDVAQGHHVLVKEMIGFIKGLDFKSALGDYVSDSFAIREQRMGPGRGLTSIPLSYRPKIIAGNVATPEAVRDLAEWGADCVKCGIGGGKSCSTRNQTGFHVPMFTCAKECAEKGGLLLNVSVAPGGYIPYETKTQIPLIFDGGIRENGDIVKALVAGGGQNNLVMAGSLFAACVDAPGENVYWSVTAQGQPSDKIRGKRYHGSASEHQKGQRKHVEGIQIEIPYNGMTVAEKMQDVKEALSSAVSYAGGTTLAAFRDVKWVEARC